MVGKCVFLILAFQDLVQVFHKMSGDLAHNRNLGIDLITIMCLYLFIYLFIEISAQLQLMPK